MSAEKYQQCPVSHNLLPEDVNFTVGQTIMQQGAYDIYRDPSNVDHYIAEVDQKLAEHVYTYRDGAAPEVTTRLDFYRTADTRRLLPRAHSFGMLSTTTLGIIEGTTRGATQFDLTPRDYSTPYGHTFPGDTGALMDNTVVPIEDITDSAFDHLTQYERAGFFHAFAALTNERKVKAEAFLDAKYPDWRRYPQEILQNPRHHTGELPDEAMYPIIIRNLHPGLDVSVSNASRSAAHTAGHRLRSARGALENSDCPRELWQEITWANVGKIVLPAMMNFWANNRLERTVANDSSNQQFVVAKENGDWNLAINNPRDQKLFERGRPNNCQGAYILPPQNEAHAALLRRLSNFVNEKSGGRKPDISIENGVAATHILGFAVVAVATMTEYI